MKAAKRCLVALISLSVVAVAAACGSNDSAGDAGSGPATMRVTVTPGIGSIPFKAALENGFFEKNGLKIKVTEGYDFKSYLAAMDRQFDAVMIVPTSTVLAVDAGLHLKAYAGMEATAANVNAVALVTKDPRLHSLEDVANAGASVGVLELGDLTTAPWKEALKGTGADVNDIKQVAMSFPDMMGQLEAGRVDAVQAAAGFYEPLLAKGYRIIYRHPQEALVAAGAKLPTAFADFVSTDKFMSKHLDEAKAFQKSIEEGIAWVDAHPDETYAMFAKWVGRDPASVKTIAMPAWKANIEASDFDPWAKIMADSGLIKPGFDSSSLIQDGM